MNKHKHIWYLYDWGYDEKDRCFLQFRCRKCSNDNIIKCEDIKKYWEIKNKKILPEWIEEDNK